MRNDSAEGDLGSRFRCHIRVQVPSSRVLSHTPSRALPISKPIPSFSACYLRSGLAPGLGIAVLVQAYDKIS